MTVQPRFLAVDDVIRLHAIAIEDQGGDPSIRDRGLLDSAVAMPRQQFGGEFLHADIPAMAAAYAFHICSNHAFIDGNKRAATAAMIVFLSDNGWSFDADADAAEPVILRLAAGELDKGTVTSWLRDHVHEKPKFELREFLRSVKSEVFVEAFQAVRPDASGHKPEEFQATADEVVRAAPFVHTLLELNKLAVAANDETKRLTATVAILTVAALYRIAEDMGYEW